MVDRIEKEGPSLALFFILTGLYLAAVIIGACERGFFDPAGTPISPSEWGDVLAGVFSPLAFLWLIYASLSQRTELELQRKELKKNNKTQEDQRNAMDKQVEALSAQAKLLAAQATATYEPIFVVGEVEGSPVQDSFIVVWVENLGGDITNVLPANGVEMRKIKPGPRVMERSVRSNFLAHWPRTGKVAITITLEEGERDRPVIDISFRRLDGVRRRVAMMFNKQNRSVDVISSINEPDWPEQEKPR